MDFADDNRERADVGDCKVRNVSTNAGRSFVDRSAILTELAGKARARRERPIVGNMDEEDLIRLDERGRLARELHDSTSQLLVVLDLQLARLKRSDCASRSPDFDEVLVELQSTVRELHKEVRSIGKSAHDPSALARDLSVMANEFAAHTGLDVHTDIQSLPANISPKLAHTLYRVAQEALANVSRHASASNVCLCLSASGPSLELRIADDGVGFEGCHDGDGCGRGIANMQLRLAEVGGMLTFSDNSPGAVVTARADLDMVSIG